MMIRVKALEINPNNLGKSLFIYILLKNGLEKAAEMECRAKRYRSRGKKKTGLKAI